MGETTAISWADKTFNPWVGCTKVSPGCDHCYAEGWAKRSGRDVWGAGKARQHTAPAYWREPLKWNAEAEATGVRPRVFPSLCDPFDAEAPQEWRQEFWELIDRTPYIDWLLLSKRPNNMAKMLPHLWSMEPAKNVWLGTSVESQAQTWRIEKLLGVEAAVHFLSLEPLIGPLTLDVRVLGRRCECPHDYHPYIPGEGWQHYSECRASDRKGWVFTGPDSSYRLAARARIDWVITGGESGHGRRPMELEWADDIRRQCEEAGVAFWFKQISDLKPGQGEDALGRVYHELPRLAA